jgi:hypothetical protein
MLGEEGLGLKTGKQADRPMAKSYHPELDVTRELDQEGSSKYHQLIGMLRWDVELGRVDILLEVSLHSTHLANPREGHLEAAYNIFAYLNKQQHPPIVLDDKVLNMNEEPFVKSDWKESIYVMGTDLPVCMCSRDFRRIMQSIMENIAEHYGKYCRASLVHDIQRDFLLSLNSFSQSFVLLVT